MFGPLSADMRGSPNVAGAVLAVLVAGALVGCAPVGGSADPNAKRAASETAADRGGATGSGSSSAAGGAVPGGHGRPRPGAKSVPGQGVTRPRADGRVTEANLAVYQRLTLCMRSHGLTGQPFPKVGEPFDRSLMLEAIWRDRQVFDAVLEGCPSYPRLAGGLG